MGVRKEILNREKAYWESQYAFEWLSERGIQTVLESTPPVRGDVLGLCSGSGMFPKRIPDTYDRYISLDLSLSLLQRQRQELPQLHQLVGNAENPAIVSSAFDLVLVFAGLHHLSDVKKAIQNGYRVLRSGGRFVAFEPNADCWYRKPMLLLKSILGLYTEDEKFLHPQKLKAQMEAAGFVNIEIKYITPEYNPAHLKTFLNKSLASLMELAVAIHDGPNWQSFFIILGTR